MEINATLLMQMCNFIVAYIIMDRIVLRLAANIIQTEDRKFGSVDAEVAELEKRIASRLRYNEDDWLILQKRLQSECPNVTVGQHTQASYESSSFPPLKSQEQVHDTVNSLKGQLIRTVLEVKDKHG